MRSFRIFMLIGAVAAILPAQPTGQPLTNADILTMLSHGLPETTIMLKIDDAVDKGMVNLDASAGALIELKDKGASEAVLNEVLWAEPFKAAWEERMADLQQKETEEKVAPGFPDRAGVYVRSGAEWKPMSSFLLWLPLYSGEAWMHGAHPYSVPVGKGRSDMQIADSQPKFYVRAPGSGERWQIIRATSRKDQLEIRLASEKHLVPGEEITPTNPGDIRVVPLTHVAGSIFSLRPDAALGAGEYILCSSVEGGPGLMHCYNFAVRQ